MDDALAEAPMTPARYVHWFVASGGALLGGFSIVSLGVAIPLLKHELAITPLLTGLIGSALMLGAVFGAALGGIAADRVGRKRAFIADMAILAVGSVLSAASSNPWCILAGQCLIGVGVGSDFPTSSSYVSEIMPRAIRSRMTVATISLQSVGMIVAAVIAMVILRADPSITAWRVLLGASALIALAFMTARLVLPESPRWLADRKRLAESASFHPAVTSGAVATVSTNASVSADARTARRPARSGFAALFTPRYRARTMLVSLPWFLMDIATYGVGLFTPVILGAMHFGSKEGGTLAAVFADAKGSAAVDLFLLFGFMAGIWAVTRFGRIPMQVLGFAGMAVGMAVLMLAIMVGGGGDAHLGLVIAGFVIFNFAMNAGPNATTFTLAPALFPTAIRASASGFAAACAKVGATIGTFVVPQLQAAWGLTGVLAVMVLVSIAGLAATVAFAHDMREEDNVEEAVDERLSRASCC
ncbi:MFS transporter [Bradyrhizobium sp. USDA 4353]